MFMHHLNLALTDLGCFVIVVIVKIVIMKCVLIMSELCVSSD